MMSTVQILIGIEFSTFYKKGRSLITVEALHTFQYNSPGSNNDDGGEDGKRSRE